MGSEVCAEELIGAITSFEEPASRSKLAVNVSNTIYEIDSNQTSANGEVQCDPGYVSSGINCGRYRPPQTLFKFGLKVIFLDFVEIYFRCLDTYKLKDILSKIKQHPSTYLRQLHILFVGISFLHLRLLSNIFRSLFFQVSMTTACTCMLLMNLCSSS